MDYIVSSGIVCEKYTVGYGGVMSVLSGGVADTTTVSGRMDVSNGGAAYNTNVDQTGKLFISSGGTAYNSIVNEGKMDVSSGGTASYTTLSNGSISIIYGGTADITTVSQGSMFVFSGGIANSTTINGFGSLYVSNGGTATNTTLNDWGRMYVSSGGIACNTIINSHGGLNISSSGTATNTTIGKSGFLSVSSGGIACDTMVNSSGSLDIPKGGTVAYATVNSGGSLYVSSGGIANNVTVNPGGSMRVVSGGKATSVVENGGYVYVASGIVENNGYVGVASGAEATFAINSFRELTLIRTTATVHSGTTANDIQVGSSGRLEIFSGGIANDTTVNLRGTLNVFSGGTANNATINSSGYLIVFQAGKLTGQMSFGSEAIVSAYDGAILDFDLTRTEPGNEVLVNNLLMIQGAPLYTLTVDGTQISGTYSLASGATKYNIAVSVVDTTGNNLGRLEVGHTTKIEDINYMLSIVNGNLSVTLDRIDTVVPTICEVKANTTSPTQTVTITAVFTDNVEIKSSLYRIGENGSWKDYENGVTVSENTTVYFKAIDTSGNESTIANYKVTNIKPPDQNNWLYNKKTKLWNEDIPVFVVNNVVHGDSMVYLDPQGTIESEDNKFNFLGRTGTEEDAADYAKIELAKGAALKFSVDSTVAGTFYVYEKTADKNGTPVTKQRQKITVKANNTSPTKLTTIYLEKGEYFVGMEVKLPSATDKPEFSAYYNVNLTGTKFYNDADDGWNDHVYQLDEKGKEIKTKLNTKLVNDALVLDRGVADIKIDTGTMDTDDWVGFSDTIDYKMLTLKKAVNLTLLFSATDNAKLTLWAVSFKNGKYTLTNKGGVTVKAGKTGWVNSKFLAAGAYFISVASTNATKGGNAYYSVHIIDNKTVFFDSADNGKNNVLYNKKGKTFYDDAQHTFVTTAVNGTDIKVQLDSDPVGADGYENFVGYQDKVDYAKITLTADGNLSFNLKTSGNATFAVYKKGKDKKGNDTLETIQTTKLTLAKGESIVEKTTDALLGLEAGEYYISMTAKSTKSNNTGSVFYNVTATLEPSLGDALAMPETSDSLGISDALSFSQYDTDVLACSSIDLASQRIFEENGKGILASL